MKHKINKTLNISMKRILSVCTKIFFKKKIQFPKTKQEPTDNLKFNKK